MNGGNNSDVIDVGLFLWCFLTATDSEIKAMKDRMDDRTKELVKDLVRRFNILLED